MNFNIVMGDFHILQSYLSHRLYCENNISYNYIEKIECKQWYAQMADVMNIFQQRVLWEKLSYNCESRKKIVVVSCTSFIYHGLIIINEQHTYNIIFYSYI